MDPARAETLRSSRTCALLPMHVFGNPCDVVALSALMGLDFLSDSYPLTDSLGELMWRTAPCPDKQRTIFAFTASLSNDPGETDICVNGDLALSFQMDRQQKVRKWTRGEYALTFVPKKDIGGNSGVMLLDVPADRITATLSFPEPGDGSGGRASGRRKFQAPVPPSLP